MQDYFTHLTIYHWIGNLGMFLLFFAFLLRHVLYLRINVIFASILSIIYDYNISSSPLWQNIFWRSLIIAANIFGIIMFLYYSRHIAFPAEYERLRKKVFHNMKDHEFKKLIDISVFESADPGEVIIHHGQQMTRIGLICEGKFEIKMNNELLNYSLPGSFVGEMSFLSGEPATADVIAVEPSRYIMWDQSDLRKLLSKNSEIKNSLDQIFSRELINKIISTDLLQSHLESDNQRSE